MAWYDINQSGRQVHPHNLNIHIITDSSTVARRLNMATDMTRPMPSGAGTVLGSYFREMSRKGYTFHNHWAKRMSNQFNWAADLIAGLSRTRFLNTISDDNSSLTIAQRSADFLAQVELIDPRSRELIDIYEIGS